MKSYFTSVDINSSTLTFYKVHVVEEIVVGTFESLEGYAVILGCVIGSLVIYIIAAGIYQIIKRRLDAEEEAPLLTEKSGAIKNKSRDL